jgi:hypothetical protein
MANCMWGYASRNAWIMNGASLALWPLSIVRNSELVENTTFRKSDLFPSSGEWKGTPTLLGPLVSVSFRSHEDGKRPRFRNVVFSGCLAFRTMGPVHKAGYFRVSVIINWPDSESVSKSVNRSHDLCCNLIGLGPMLCSNLVPHDLSLKLNILMDCVLIWRSSHKCIMWPTNLK